MARILRTLPNLRRRMEQWLQNAECEANTLSALLGVSMLDVAQQEDPSIKGGGQSPFAIARGVTFERDLLKQNADVLVQSLLASGLLQAPPVAHDFRISRQGGPWASPEEAELAWQQQSGALWSSSKPVLLLGPPLRLPSAVSLLDGLFIPDVVLGQRNSQGVFELRVGEIKSYHDRGGHTDGQKLARARAQAGLYVQVLRGLLLAENVQDRVQVSGEGFLVLLRPGSGKPSVRPREDFRWQARQAEMHLRRMEEMAGQIRASVAGKKGGKHLLPLVQQAPVRYREACLSFCDRAPVCHKQACDSADPAILGDDVARQLGPIQLDRARQLLEGAPAASPIEADFVRRMNEVDDCIRRVS